MLIAVLQSETIEYSQRSSKCLPIYLCDVVVLTYHQVDTGPTHNLVLPL